MKLKSNSIGKRLMKGSTLITITGEESEKQLKWLHINFPHLFEKEEIKPSKKRRKNDKAKTESIESHILDTDGEIRNRELENDDSTEETGE